MQTISSAQCGGYQCDPAVPTSEDDLFDQCDLRLLFIEPGVFGELKTKPAMPPAPSSYVITEVLLITYSELFYLKLSQHLARHSI